MNFDAFVYLRAVFPHELCQYIHTFCDQLDEKRHADYLCELKIQTRIGMIIFGGFSLCVSAKQVPDIAMRLFASLAGYRIQQSRNNIMPIDYDEFVENIEGISLHFDTSRGFVADACVFRYGFVYAIIQQDEFIEIITQLLCNKKPRLSISDIKHFAKNLDVKIR